MPLADAGAIEGAGSVGNGTDSAKPCSTTARSPDAGVPLIASTIDVASAVTATVNPFDLSSTTSVAGAVARSTSDVARKSSAPSFTGAKNPTASIASPLARSTAMLDVSAFTWNALGIGGERPLSMNTN